MQKFLNGRNYKLFMSNIVPLKGNFKFKVSLFYILTNERKMNDYKG